MVFAVAAAAGWKLGFRRNTQVGENEERRRYHRKHDGKADRSGHFVLTPVA
jgi:hypothetical protein